MKKILSLFTVAALALALVACKKEPTVTDLDEIRDHLEKVTVVNGFNENYARTETFNNTTANVTTMNHYNTTGANESDMYSLIVGTLFQTDFDWAGAVEDGLAATPHDLSRVEAGEVSISEFGIDRYPSLAATKPESVKQSTHTTTFAESKLLMDTKWRINLRDDITFQDGLKINAHVFSYSWKQLLSPKLNNARVQYLTDAVNLGLVNGKEYYLQGKPVAKDSTEMNPAVKWEEVGFKVINDTTFEIELINEVSQWHVMGMLTSAIYSAVHPEVFESSKDVTGSTASYGSIDYKVPSSGPYLIKNWQDGTAYRYNVNKAYKGYRSEDYRIKSLNYVVNSNETSILNEFESGNVDVAGVGSAVAFPTYKDNPATKITPTTATFRFALGAGTRPAESKWEHTEVSNAAMADKDFRKALYLALDREHLVSNIRPNVKPSGTLLTSLYQATEEANESYRATEAAQKALAAAGLTTAAIDNYGFDLAAAKEAFNTVYDRLAAAGKLKNGKIYIQVVLFDAESNRKLSGWAKAQYENAFGTDKIEIVESFVSEDAVYEAWDTKDFDLTFSGWNGMQFNPAGILSIVYSSLNSPDTMLEGAITDELEITADLSNFKAHVESKGANATAEEKAILATLTADGVWTGILDFDSTKEGFETMKYKAVAHLIALESFAVDYMGKKDDFASITAGIEGALIGDFITVPLFENVGATIYADNVVFDLPEYHTWLGWGGLLYRSLAK